MYFDPTLVTQAQMPAPFNPQMFMNEKGELDETSFIQAM